MAINISSKMLNIFVGRNFSTIPYLIKMAYKNINHKETTKEYTTDKNKQSAPQILKNTSMNELSEEKTLKFSDYDAIFIVL